MNLIYEFLSIGQKIFNSVYGPFSVIALLTGIPFLAVQTKRKNAVLLFSLFCVLIIIVLRYIVRVESSRYSIILIFPAIFLCVGGLETIRNARKGLAILLLSGLIIFFVARIGVILHHSQYNQDLGEIICSDQKKFRHVSLISAERNATSRFSYYSGIEDVYMPETSDSILEDLKKYLWYRHYSADAIYYVIRQSPPLKSSLSFAFPGLENKQTMKLIFHERMSSRRKDELCVYRQIVTTDSFLPPVRVIPLLNGDFEGRTVRVSPAGVNSGISLGCPFQWGILGKEHLDPHKKAEIAVVPDALSGHASLKMSQESQQQDLIIFSPEITSGSADWVEFKADLSSDAELMVKFFFYDQKRTNNRAEQVLFLNGECNAGRGIYRIPLSPQTWRNPFKYARVVLSLKQGSVLLDDFLLLNFTGMKK